MSTFSSTDALLYCNIEKFLFQAENNTVCAYSPLQGVNKDLFCCAPAINPYEFDFLDRRCESCMNKIGHGAKMVKIRDTLLHTRI